MLYGVDVHGVFQRGIDFKLLKRQGYSFAAMKFTQGTTFTAAGVSTWPKAIRDAGLILGGYHWIMHGEAVKQAEFFFESLRKNGALNGPLLVQLDCEDNATYQDVLAWKSRWNQLSGNHPFLLYTGKWWWGASNRNWNGPNVTPYLWDSHYLTADLDTIADDPIAFANRIPASWWNPGYGGWTQSTFLQFTSKGDAGTLGNNVDLNATKLTMDQLLRLAGSTTPVAPVKDDDDMGKLVAITDGLQPGGLFISAGSVRRHIKDLQKMIDAGLVAWPQDYETLTSAEADPIFGPDIETLRGEKGEDGEDGEDGDDGMSEEEIKTYVSGLLNGATAKIELAE